MSFVQNTKPTFPYQPQAATVNIANGDGQTLKTVCTPGSNGSKIIGLIATSTDTSARDVTVYRTNSAVDYPLGTTTVPITAGTIAATNGVNLLTNIAGLPTDSDGNPFIYLISGDTLRVEALTTVTAAKNISVTAIYMDF
jgi:hypothetical protein